jgi:sugar porter (SP) family MFS transporter
MSVVYPFGSRAVPLGVGAAAARGRGLVIHASAVAALGGLLFGFDTAVIAGTTEALKEVFGLDPAWLGFTVAIALIGTMVGSFAIGRAADAFGRKRALFALAAGYFVSAVGCGLAPGWGTFLAARFLGGLAVGCASVVAPLYIAEIAPPAWRGRLVGVSQLNIVLGILLSFVSDYYLARSFAPDVAWRWMLGVVVFPSLIFFVLLFTIPESPRWLAGKGHRDAARRVLERLGEPDADLALAAIAASLTDRPGPEQARERERLFQPRFAWPIFLAWTLAMFNQLSGINALMYYAPRIFLMAGASRDSALLQAVAVGGTNLLFTIAAMFVIDRFGRRVLMLIGSVGMAVCLGLVAAQFAGGPGAATDAGGSGAVVLAALLGYIAFFAFSQGAVIWVFLSEIFPNGVRAQGQALGTFTHWFMAAAVSWIFPVVAEGSAAWVFGFFAAMMALQFVFTWTVMPETKGSTLEDVERRWAGGIVTA